jgi:quercetin dioxygenase-like cupin family protein
VPVRIVRAGETSPELVPDTMAADWLVGPTADHGLDAGLVHFAPGATTPPHVHLVGQVLVGLHGQGFVQTGDGERVVLEVGDVVITPAGEAHVHGATAQGPFTHLSVTTGGYELPGPR